MLITPIVFAASIALGEVLVAERHFVYYALAPILYNVGIVLGTVLLHDRIGIAAAAVGAVIGSFLHLGIRLVGMRRTTVRVRFRLDLRMAAIHEFVRLMVPKMLSHPIEPLTFLFFTRVATTLVAGSVTAVSFARNFQSVPVALIGVAISLAAFPGAVGLVGGRRPRGVLAARAHERGHDHPHLDRRRDRARRRGAAGDPCPARRRQVRRRGRRAHRDRAGRVRALGPLRCAGPPPRPRACTRRTTRVLPLVAAAGRVRRDRGRRRSRSSTASGIVAIPLGLRGRPGRPHGPPGHRAGLAAAVAAAPRRPSRRVPA